MMKRPVVTSDLAPMNSVAGGGAALADPYDVTSIAKAIDRVISDQAYRDELIARGAENVKRYQAEAISRQYAAVYRDLMAEAAA